jgi:hypothetical protein
VRVGVGCVLDMPFQHPCLVVRIFAGHPSGDRWLLVGQVKVNERPFDLYNYNLSKRCGRLFVHRCFRYNDVCVVQVGPFVVVVKWTKRSEGQRLCGSFGMVPSYISCRAGEG